jgi:hypothetical protein
MIKVPTFRMIGLIMLMHLQCKIGIGIHLAGKEQTTIVILRQVGSDVAPGALGLKVGMVPAVIPLKTNVFVWLVRWSCRSSLVEVFEVVG